MAAAVRERTISARELLELHLARIEEVNPQVNALVSLDPDRARAQAAEADERLARGAEVGPLHGLPYAVKDTHEVAGWRTTYGSPLMADHVPERDELVVERVRAAGAVIVAKTNTPELASGSHTFNPVFGTTLNPYDLGRSAGGSSGGSAVALATGMVALADGSDMGGSLRNPASFNNVVGLRPGLGRVPEWPHPNAWETLSVSGPMARTVGDLALLLSVMAGPDPRVPLALETPGSVFAEPLGRLASSPLDGLRVAISTDLGGAFEVDAEVAGVVADQARVLREAGSTVVEAHPDLAEAEDTFRTLRAWHFQARYGALLAANPGRMKPSLADNIRAGESLTGADVARGVPPAHRARGADAGLLRVPRRAGAAGEPGAAVPGRPGVPGRDQRPGAGDLPRLDAVGLPDHRDRLPGDLRAGRVHLRRAAGRGADRGAALGRATAARGGARLRAAHPGGRASSRLRQGLTWPGSRPRRRLAQPHNEPPVRRHFLPWLSSR